MRVAFQGRPGAYSEFAARSLLGERVLTLPCSSFDDVARGVEARAADFGILPVHNTLAGVIASSSRLLAQHHVKVEAELSLPIRHTLLGPRGLNIDHIREVHSHPVALAQCRRFFERRPYIVPLAAQDTAGALEDIVRNATPHAAAIAGAHTAGIYNVEILQYGLEDCADNRTLFILFSAEQGSQ